MRKFFSFTFIALIGLFSLSGCSKSGGGSSSSTGTMTATVSNAPFNSTYCYESSSGAYYSVNGTANNATISIVIKSNNIAATTYNFDGTGTNNAASYTTSSGTVKSAKSGSVTFTAINVGVSFVGTFNFTCTDGTVVSGSFTAVL